MFVTAQLCVVCTWNIVNRAIYGYLCLQELEKGIEMLHKTHGQEVRALMVKNKALSQNLEASKERADKLFSHLKVYSSWQSH